MRSPQGRFSFTRYKSSSFMAILFPCLLILGASVYLGVGRETPAATKGFTRVQPTPETPKPPPAPTPWKDWEPATNCEPIHVQMTTQAEHAYLRCTLNRGES